MQGLMPASGTPRFREAHISSPRRMAAPIPPRRCRGNLSGSLLAQNREFPKTFFLPSGYMTSATGSQRLVPSTVGLGVLMEKNNTVKQAGGFIVQLMPFAEGNVIEKLEANLSRIHSVTKLLEDGNSPEQILGILLEGMDMEILSDMPVEFYCNCSRERVAKALYSIGKKEMDEMIKDGEPIEVKCHFCNTAYRFSVEDLVQIRQLQE